MEVIVGFEGELEGSAALEGNEVEIIELIRPACRTREENSLAVRRHVRAGPIQCLLAPYHVSGGDAVQVEIEHAEGTAVTVLMPYNKKRFGRGVEFGNLQASPGTRQLWID